ncbi:MAG TPA: hypothetical protein VGH62_09000 [Bradyrhizobium sp.]|jgi:hypothetical protein
MDLRYVSDGFHLDRKDMFAREPQVPSWLSTDSQPPISIDTGDNSAGNGGDGYFAGHLVDSSYAAFEPLNMAQAGAHATAVAHQSNIGYFDQAATQIAGIGADGGNWNAAMGGSLGVFGSIGSDAISTGDNSAGNGGDGQFFGALVHAPVAIYDPINIAIAGSHGSADAHQSNTVQLHQGTSQIAGVGGNGGNGNAATGGHVSAFGAGAPGHSMLGAGHASEHGWIGSDVIASGDNHAGNGGDGYFYGSLVHASFALYDPINIAVAGYNSSAHADQANNVEFDQSAFQMAGIGGNGGSGNAAIGGSTAVYSAIQGLIGSDVIATGGNSAGSGGDGHFTGSLIDLNIAIYAPINIAVAGPNSTADAHQTNSVQFDQSAIQIAGVGGDGGHGNAAFGGDFAMHVLADHHLLGHA